MKPKPLVLLTYPIHRQAIADALAPYARVRIEKYGSRSFYKVLNDCDGLITRFFDPVDEKFLSRAPKLRVVSQFAVGVDNIDLKACARRGIRVTNTPEVLTRATAELALALLLASARRFPEGEALCRKARFKGWAPDLLLGLELKNRRAVLVGKGRIGRETACLFKGIGLKIDWITRATSEREIRTKLKRAQVLSLHVPLTPETHHWLSAKRLACLPPDAIVINTTRGPVVDEQALIRTLQRRKIFAAGLDVFEYEPRIPEALRKLPNAVLLPHLGSATRETREAMARLAISGLLRVLGQIPGGQRPWNEVNSGP